MMLDPKHVDDEMLEEYDFSRATRGNPYTDRLKRTVTIESANGTDRTTVELTAIVAADGTTTLQLPPNITPGQHRITLLIQEEQI